MAHWMVALVGEQRIPNYIPVKYSRFRPDNLILVASNFTTHVATLLTEFLEPNISCEIVEVDPYDPLNIRTGILSKIHGQTDGNELVINFTGGTKVMSLAALEVARMLRCDALYYQTEGNTSRLWHYRFQGDALRVVGSEDISVTITLDEYLRLHIGKYDLRPLNDPFEIAVLQILETVGHEVLAGIHPRELPDKEIDFAIRIGNQVGIGEIKTSPDARAIGQITNIANRETLGTYIKKFLIHAKSLHPNNLDLAHKNNIKTIQLVSFYDHRTLSEHEQDMLKNEIVEAMQPSSRSAPSSA